MADIVAKLKIQRVLRSRARSAPNYIIKPSDDEYVHLENDLKWRGPFQVAKTFNKCVLGGLDKVAQYIIDHVLPVSKAIRLGLFQHSHNSFSKYQSSPELQKKLQSLSNRSSSTVAKTGEWTHTGAAIGTGSVLYKLIGGSGFR